MRASGPGTGAAYHNIKVGVMKYFCRLRAVALLLLHARGRFARLCLLKSATIKRITRKTQIAWPLSRGFRTAADTRGSSDQPAASTGDCRGKLFSSSSHRFIARLCRGRRWDSALCAPGTLTSREGGPSQGDGGNTLLKWVLGAHGRKPGRDATSQEPLAAGRGDCEAVQLAIRQ